jgi:DNA-directed RNA polymerase subunit RPC12/RpoP
MMEEWYCFKCKEKMVEAEISFVYLDAEEKGKGIKCPKCGVAYFDEQTVLNVIIPAQEDIEGK